MDKKNLVLDYRFGFKWADQKHAIGDQKRHQCYIGDLFINGSRETRVDSVKCDPQNKKDVAGNGAILQKENKIFVFHD